MQYPFRSHLSTAQIKAEENNILFIWTTREKSFEENLNQGVTFRRFYLFFSTFFRCQAEKLSEISVPPSRRRRRRHQISHILWGGRERKEKKKRKFVVALHCLLETTGNGPLPPSSFILWWGSVAHLEEIALLIFLLPIFWLHYFGGEWKKIMLFGGFFDRQFLPQKSKHVSVKMSYEMYLRFF